MNHGHDLTADGFSRFLAWLDPDRDRAGDKYKEIHRRLTKLFALRGAQDPEELADETMSRVARKADALREAYHGDPAAYFYGVARNVFREYLRSSEIARRRVRPALRGPGSTEEAERRHACLDRCLETELRPGERELILEYYREEKRRKMAGPDARAEEAQASSSALRKRTQRIRQRLQRCILDCLGCGR